MSDPYLGQIIPVGFNFAPRGWALCAGQLMSISQNTTLYGLIGTTYGGDGVNTFALPNIQSRVPIHYGQGQGLTNRTLGTMVGVETVTLTITQMPAHTHPVGAVGGQANNQTSPTNNIWGDDTTQTLNLYSNAAPDTAMSGQSTTMAGGNQPHDNLQPYLAVNFCISLVGVFPQPSS